MSYLLESSIINEAWSDAARKAAAAGRSKRGQGSSSRKAAARAAYVAARGKQSDKGFSRRFRDTLKSKGFNVSYPSGSVRNARAKMNKTLSNPMASQSQKDKARREYRAAVKKVSNSPVSGTMSAEKRARQLQHIKDSYVKRSAARKTRSSLFSTSTTSAERTLAKHYARSSVVGGYPMAFTRR